MLLINVKRKTKHFVILYTNMKISRAANFVMFIYFT